MSLKAIIKQNPREIQLILAATLLLLAPAIYNGFPFTYSDTHSYIHSGMTFDAPFERPIFYGLWLRYTSLQQSLWLPIILQALLTAMLLYRLLDRFAGIKNQPFQFLILAAVIGLFTGAGINAAILLPDAFSPLLVMGFVLLATDKRFRAFYFVIVLIAGIMHSSHFLILIAMSILFGIYRWRKKQLNRNSVIQSFALIAGVFLILSTSTYIKYKVFTPTRSATFFFMGRLAETGVLRQYVRDHCEEVPPGLCASDAKLLNHASTFIWDENCPLFGDGGYWKNEAAYNKIIKGVLTQPKYLFPFLYRSFFDGFHQLFLNRILLAPLNADLMTFQLMEKHFFTDSTAARQSMQMSGANDFAWINGIYILLLLFSLIVILYAGIMLQSQLSLGIGLLVLGIVANAWITATFANLDSRLQARIAWLILVAAYIAYRQMEDLKSRSKG